MSGRKLSSNEVLLLLSMVTAVIVGVAAIVSLTTTPSFQFIIIDVYILVSCVVMFIMDVFRPLVCNFHFSFWRFFWGRALVFLIMGALVYSPAPYQMFAGIWTWVMCAIFAFLAILSWANRLSGPGQVEPLRSQPGAGQPTTFKSSGGG